MADEVATKTSNDKLHEALKLLNEAAGEKKDEVKELVANKYTHLKEVISESQSKMSAKLHDVKDVSTEKAKEIAKTVDDNVHKNPWPYIGGAAVGALLLGYILGKKS